jgi:hypothetical protein
MTLLDEAESIAASLSTPLFKAILRAAVRRARDGDMAGLAAEVDMGRAQLAKQRARDAVADAEEERRLAEVRRDAEGQDPEAVAKAWRKLRAEQDEDYRRWGARRPDERTARKAHTSNRLDGRARRMAALSETYEALTGRRLG